LSGKSSREATFLGMAFKAYISFSSSGVVKDNNLPPCISSKAIRSIFTNITFD
jgi:hypothetical protein